MYDNTDHVVIAGNLNARVGNQTIENVIGVLGKEPINGNGVKLRELANTNKLKITNTFFREKAHKQVYLVNKGTSIID